MHIKVISRNIAILTSFLFLMSCSAPAINSHDILESEFDPCIIINDFLTQRDIVQGGVKKTNSNFSEKFVFVVLDLIHVKKRGDEAMPKTTIETLWIDKSHIKTRLKFEIPDETFNTYIAAQSNADNYSTCSLPKHVYTKDDGLKRIEDIVAYNQSQRKNMIKDLQVFTDQRKITDKKLSKEEFEKSMQESEDKLSDLENRYETKPYDLHKFSRVGVNKTDKQAFFYHENFCGMLCGRGSYIVMEYRDHNWVVIGSVMTWIS